MLPFKPPTVGQYKARLQLVNCSRLAKHRQETVKAPPEKGGGESGMWVTGARAIPGQMATRGSGVRQSPPALRHRR